MNSPRFIVDLNVGKLAKWLRIMGYDTTFLPEANDGELIRIAMTEDRILLTKDTQILERRVAAKGPLKVLLISADAVGEQLRQVVQSFGLEWLQGAFSRCIECNRPLMSKPKAEVQDLVPPYVFKNHDEFMECPSCRKVYWKGSHWQRMHQELFQLKGEFQEGASL